jgi:hypothetical protein
VILFEKSVHRCFAADKAKKKTERKYPVSGVRISIDGYDRIVIVGSFFAPPEKLNM